MCRSSTPTGLSSARMSFVLSLLFIFFLLPSRSIQASYSIQAILPLSQTDDPDHFAQWAKAAKLAAAQVSASWAPSNSLYVDVLDYLNDELTLQMIGSAAMLNSSVLGVISDELGSRMLSGSAANFDLPLLISPSGPQTVLNTRRGSSTYTLEPPMTLVRTLSALLAKYSWNRIALIYSIDDDGKAVRDAIVALPGLNVTLIGVPTDADDQSPYIQSVIKSRNNIVVIANKNHVQVSNLLNHHLTEIYTHNSVAFIYINQDDTPADWLTQGCLIIEASDANQTNQTSFKEELFPTDEELHKGSIVVFDTVNMIAQCISNILSSSEIVSRTSILDQLDSVDYQGVGGRTRFDPSNKFRKDQFSHILNVNSSDVTYLSLSMEYNGSYLVDIFPPLFFGEDGEIAPNDEVEFIPMVTSLAFTSSYVDPRNKDILPILFDFYVHFINNEAAVLPPNKQIINFVIDSLGEPAQVVQDALLSPAIGAVCTFGDYSTTLTAVLQSVASSYNIPHMATVSSSTLSNRQLYPTLSRVVSSSDAEGHAVIALAELYGWTEMTVIATGEGLGADAAHLLVEDSVNHGITIEHHIDLGEDVSTYYSQMTSLFAKKPQIVIFLPSDYINDAIHAFYLTGYRPPAVVTNVLSSLNLRSLAESSNVPSSFFYGWISLTQPGGQGDLWTDFLATAALSTHEEFFPAIPMLSSVLTAATELDSFMIMAKTIASLIQQGIDPTNGTAFTETVRSFKGTLYSGSIEFDENGDRIGTIDAFNIQNTDIMSRVGRWTVAAGIVFTSPVIWPSGSTQVPPSSLPRRQEWLKWDSGAGIALAILAILGIVSCFATLIAIYKWRISPVITSATYEFLIVMLFGVALGFGSAFTWIGKPVPYICVLRIWLPPIAFLLIIAPLIAKTWRLWKIFTLKDLKLVPVPLRTLVLLVCVLVGFQVVICILWVSLGTVQTAIVNDTNDDSVAYVLCKTAMANRVSSYVTFGYIGLVLLIGCWLAYKIRKLPRDFNESKWIGRTMYNVFLIAGLIIILGYTLSRYYIVVNILIVVCTLGICYGSIGLMMAPKIWTLIRHPEKRSSSSENTSSRFRDIPLSVTDRSTHRSAVDRSRRSKSPVSTPSTTRSRGASKDPIE